MKIALVFLCCIAVLVYLLNRQRSTMHRLRASKRFAPDWSRTRGGPVRRRRSRFGNLRSEMRRLEEEARAAATSGDSQQAGDSVSSPEEPAPDQPARGPAPPQGGPSERTPPSTG